MRYRLAGPLLIAVAGLPVGAAAQGRIELQDGRAPYPSYAGTRDVRLHAIGDEPYWDPQANYDGLPDAVDGYSALVSALIRWDLSSIPPASPIVAASIRATVTNEAGQSFGIYESLQPWVAGEANHWKLRDGARWAAPGAAALGGDHAATLLGTATGTFGARVWPLNSSGVAVVQGWIDQPSSNRGFIVQDHTQTDKLAWKNCDDPVVDERLTLRLELADGGSLLFRNGALPEPSYQGCSDTTIASGHERGANANGLRLAATWASDGETTTLISFDVGGVVPPGARVLSAALAFSVIHMGLSADLPIRAMNRPWSETAATWHGPDSSQGWADGGALDPGDHGELVGRVRASGPGRRVAQLDDAGVQLLQAWVDGARSNYGFLIGDPQVNGAWIAWDREAVDPADRPALIIDCVLRDGGECAAILPDAGGFLDAGEGDAGAPDAGDSGVPDGGSAEVPDGGPGAPPRGLDVGCDCSSSGGAVLLSGLALAMLLARRRRG